MNEKRLRPDDPRLTAYALGELEGEARAAVEAALRDDPVARAAVEDIRVMSAHLNAALADEAEEELVAFDAPVFSEPTPRRKRAPVLRFPQLYYVIGGLAACIVAIVGVQRSVPRRAELQTGATIASAPAPKTPAGTALEPAKTASNEGSLAPVGTVVAPAGQRETAKADVGSVATVMPVMRDAAVSRTTVTAPENSAVGTELPAKMSEPAAGVVSKAAPESPAPTVSSAPPAAVVVASAEQAANPAPLAKVESTPDRDVVAVSAFAVAPERQDLPPIVPAEVLSPTKHETKLAADSAGSTAVRDNDFVSAAQQPVSTFSVDADTASYASVRRFLQLKRLPPHDAVRIEEMLNFFPFRYTPPKGDDPFAASMEVAAAPWAPTHRLVRIGLKAQEVATAARPAANVVFVVDTLAPEPNDRGLPMIRESILWLVSKLRPDDRVALVTCNDRGSVVLPPTVAANAREIFKAIDTLVPGTANSRARGLTLGYELAQAHRTTGGVNRVILCTDGSSGVKIKTENQLARFIQGKAKAGVPLAAFGFGMGLEKDSLIEVLASYGSGNSGYIDSRREAEKSLYEEVNGPPLMVAKDVNVQVEFNPASVASYRLIGYENRTLKKEDFTADAFEADEIGAGHAVTALFEVVPAAGGAPIAARPQIVAEGGTRFTDPNELLTMKVLYKKPGGAIRRKLDFPLFDTRERFVDASADFKFAAAVAGFGMILRDSPHRGAATLAAVVEWAEAGAVDDPGGYRSEFLELARDAVRLAN